MLDETYRQQKLPKLGIVLNGVESGRGYGYGYYSDDKPKRKWLSFKK
jgi:hypothetical protein